MTPKARLDGAGSLREGRIVYHLEGATLSGVVFTNGGVRNGSEQFFTAESRPRKSDSSHFSDHQTARAVTSLNGKNNVEGEVRKQEPAQPTAEDILSFSREEMIVPENQDPDADNVFETWLTRVIEDCQPWFWGNSAYAVVFCVCRDLLSKKQTKADFEKMIEGLPYTRCRTYVCRPGTVSNAFRNNPVFDENIRDWDSFSVLPRIIRLRDELEKSL